jgi:hypothetical protein
MLRVFSVATRLTGPAPRFATKYNSKTKQDKRDFFAKSTSYLRRKRVQNQWDRSFGLKQRILEGVRHGTRNVERSSITSTRGGTVQEISAKLGAASGDCVRFRLGLSNGSMGHSANTFRRKIRRSNIGSDAQIQPCTPSRRRTAFRRRTSVR